MGWGQRIWVVESLSIGFGDRLGCVRGSNGFGRYGFQIFGAFGVMEMKMGFMINSIGMG